MTIATESVSETIHTAPTAASVAWELAGPVPSRQLPLTYRLGIVAAAVAMILLPIIYFGLIVMAGWLVVDYAQPGGWVSAPEVKGGLAWLIVYIAPLFCGSALVFFMVKPLFAPKAKRTDAHELNAKQEPILFEFVHTIADAVGAPRPRRIVVDMDVNASAGFTHGFWSVFTNHLTLTIGLPLAAGLSARELGGVLAHEFGHFSQGGAMRLTYIIRTVNAWFVRVVYQRDVWDERLNALGKIDLRISIVVWLTQAVIWLTRKILWGLMTIGHAISCFMLRQMEFDADTFETRMAGAEVFATTCKKLPLLGIGWQQVVDSQRTALRSQRLVDNLPMFTRHRAAQLPQKVLDAVEKSFSEEKTKWHDTHPCSLERIAAAQRLGGSGVLRVQGPALTLFEDFEALCRKTTAQYYKQECEIDVSKVTLQALDATLAETEAESEASEAFDEFFGPLLSPAHMIGIGVLPTVDGEEMARERHAAAYARQKELMPEAERLIAVYHEADADAELAARAGALVRAGFRIQHAEFKLGKKEDAGVAFSKARRKMDETREALRPIREACTLRLQWALAGALARERAEGGQTLRKEVFALIATQPFYDPRLPLMELRSLFSQMNILLENSENAGDAFGGEIRSLDAQLHTALKELLGVAADIPYPFAHARGAVTLAEYFASDQQHPEPIVQRMIAAQTVLESGFDLYHRVVGRLVTIAQRFEKEDLAEYEHL